VPRKSSSVAQDTCKCLSTWQQKYLLKLPRKIKNAGHKSRLFKTFNQITNSILILYSLIGKLTKGKLTQKSYVANHQLFYFPFFLKYCSIYKRYNYFTCFTEVSAKTNASQPVTQKQLGVISDTSSLSLKSRIRNLFLKKDTEKSAGKRKTSRKCNSREKTL